MHGDKKWRISNIFIYEVMSWWIPFHACIFGVIWDVGGAGIVCDIVDMGMVFLLYELSYEHWELISDWWHMHTPHNGRASLQCVFEDVYGHNYELQILVDKFYICIGEFFLQCLWSPLNMSIQVPCLERNHNSLYTLFIICSEIVIPDFQNHINPLKVQCWY